MCGLSAFLRSRYVPGMSTRRFPPPWKATELAECFVVQDANGFRMAYVYFDSNRMQSASVSDKLTRDEARRIASAIAKLPSLLSTPRE